MKTTMQSAAPTGMYEIRRKLASESNNREPGLYGRKLGVIAETSTKLDRSYNSSRDQRRLHSPVTSSRPVRASQIINSKPVDLKALKKQCQEDEEFSKLPSYARPTVSSLLKRTKLPKSASTRNISSVISTKQKKVSEMHRSSSGYKLSGLGAKTISPSEIKEKLREHEDTENEIPPVPSIPVDAVKMVRSSTFNTFALKEQVLDDKNALFKKEETNIKPSQVSNVQNTFALSPSFLPPLFLKDLDQEVKEQIEKRKKEAASDKKPNKICELDRKPNHTLPQSFTMNALDFKSFQRDLSKTHNDQDINEMHEHPKINGSPKCKSNRNSQSLSCKIANASQERLYSLKDLIEYSERAEISNLSKSAIQQITEMKIASKLMREIFQKRPFIAKEKQLLANLKSRAIPANPYSSERARLLSRKSLNIEEIEELRHYPHIYYTGPPNRLSRNFHNAMHEISIDSNSNGTAEGDYPVVIGNQIAFRFEIIDILGKGSFGTVLRCLDHKNGELVAIKIIGNKKRYMTQALIEASILEEFQQDETCKPYNLLCFKEKFIYREHLCLVTELLGLNLYELIKLNKFNGLPITVIRVMLRQILETLVILQRKMIIHCDLKPENILIEDPFKAFVKLVDFGSSCKSNDKLYTYIQSRFYRSPEVILRLDYGMEIDMWSLGCLAAEIHEGYPLFPGENELEQLNLIAEIIGHPDPQLVQRSPRRHQFFDQTGRLKPYVSKKRKSQSKARLSLAQALHTSDNLFLDFISGCLCWNPRYRLSPLQALEHPFFSNISELEQSKKFIFAMAAGLENKYKSTNLNIPQDALQPNSHKISVRPLPKTPFYRKAEKP